MELYRCNFCPTLITRGTLCLRCTVKRTHDARWAGEAARMIAHWLQQEYRKKDGKWWLYAHGQAARTLTDEEVDWHVQRDHQPFVPDGIPVDSPAWYDDSE